MNPLPSKQTLLLSVFDHVHLTGSIFGSIVEKILRPSFSYHIGICLRRFDESFEVNGFDHSMSKIMHWRFLVLGVSDWLRVLSNQRGRHLLLTRTCVQSLLYKTHCSTAYLVLKASFLQYWNNDFLATFNQSFPAFNNAWRSWRA